MAPGGDKTVAARALSATNRASESFAAEVFARLYSSEAVRHGCAEAIANAIRFSDQQSKSCWGITLFKHGLRLNVGKAEVMVLGSDAVYIVLDKEGVSDGFRTQIVEYLSTPVSIYKSVPGEKVQCRLPPEELARVYPLVAGAHQSFITRAAQSKPTAPIKAAFSAGVIQYLRTVSEEPVPLPSYFSDETEATPVMTIAESDYGKIKDEDTLLVEAIQEDELLTPTEKLQLINARRGQGRFRQRIPERSCRVTGIDNEKYLIASHIKPWRVCDNVERLDGENGLLLAPHIDFLFDQGFITFGGGGHLVISHFLDQYLQEKFGLLTLRAIANPLTERQQMYLVYHRQHVFQR